MEMSGGGSHVPTEAEPEHTLAAEARRGPSTPWTRTVVHCEWCFAAETTEGLHSREEQPPPPPSTPLRTSGNHGTPKGLLHPVFFPDSTMSFPGQAAAACIQLAPSTHAHREDMLTLTCSCLRPQARPPHRRCMWHWSRCPAGHPSPWSQPSCCPHLPSSQP